MNPNDIIVITQNEIERIIQCGIEKYYEKENRDRISIERDILDRFILDDSGAKFKIIKNDSIEKFEKIVDSNLFLNI